MNKKNFKNFFKTLSIILILIFLFILSFKIAYYKKQSEIISLKNNQIKTASYKEPVTSNNTDIPEIETVEGITNILLLGADFRETDTVARTDCMMVLTIDTIHNKVKLTSLMRDALVEIPGYNKSKLNHAFAWGGIDLLKNTIKKNFKLNIDKYVLIDFTGFKEVINTLGGVEVEIKEYELEELNKYILDIPDNDSELIEKEGIHLLNGTQALSYVRIRKGVGDEFGRTERQRQLLNTLMKKAKEVSIIKYPDIIKSVLNNIETNLTFTEILKLAKTVLTINTSDIQSSYVPYSEISKGENTSSYGWVFKTDLDLTSQLLNDYINLDKEPNFSEIDNNYLNLIN